MPNTDLLHIAARLTDMADTKATTRRDHPSYGVRKRDVLTLLDRAETIVAVAAANDGQDPNVDITASLPHPAALLDPGTPHYDLARRIRDVRHAITGRT